MEFEVESFRFKDTRNESEYIPSNSRILKKKKRSIFHIEKKRRDKNTNTCVEIDNNNEIIKIINVLNSRVTTL